MLTYGYTHNICYIIKYKENNMIKYLETKDLKNADNFRKLYLESFIENERVDFDKLFSGVFGDFKLVGQYDNDKLGQRYKCLIEEFLEPYALDSTSKE